MIEEAQNSSPLPVSAAIVMLLWCVSPAASPSAKADATGDTWSAAVDGLRGNYIATAFQDAGRPQVRLELELQNVRDVLNPLEIPWRAPSWNMLDLTLTDETVRRFRRSCWEETNTPLTRSW